MFTIAQPLSVAFQNKVYFGKAFLDFNMPFIKVFTNQPKEQLGDKFMPKVCEKLGQALNKDLKWFNWILETDKQMSKVNKIY